MEPRSILWGRELKFQITSLLKGGGGEEGRITSSIKGSGEQVPIRSSTGGGSRDKVENRADGY